MVKDLTPVEYLQDSLIYQMSLGARELYHSNVWAWLINKDRRFLYVFFDKNFFNSKGIDLNDYDYAVSAVREYQHRDIIIWLDNKNEKKYYYLVIENKLKSLPTRDQLEEYTVEKLGDNKNELIGAVVTGIEETLSDDERTINGYTWKFVSYSHIADEIKKYMQECPLTTTINQQIEEYCQTIHFFNQLLLEALKEEQKPTSDGGEQINKAELSTIYKKLHSARFVKKIKNETKPLEAGLPKEPIRFHFESNNSIQRNAVCIDCAYTSWEEDCDASFRIGIQIQDNQYRRFAHYYKKDNVDKTVEQLYVKMVELGWLHKSKEEFNKKMGISSQIKMRGDYCQYKGKDYIFVYQYANLEETIKGTSFDDYIARINEDLDKAKQILCSCDLSELFD